MKKKQKKVKATNVNKNKNKNINKINIVIGATSKKSKRKNKPVNPVSSGGNSSIQALQSLPYLMTERQDPNQNYRLQLVEQAVKNIQPIQSTQSIEPIAIIQGRGRPPKKAIAEIVEEQPIMMETPISEKMPITPLRQQLMTETPKETPLISYENIYEDKEQSEVKNPIKRGRTGFAKLSLLELDEKILQLNKELSLTDDRKEKTNIKAKIKRVLGYINQKATLEEQQEEKQSQEIDDIPPLEAYQDNYLQESSQGFNETQLNTSGGNLFDIVD
jgi:hypothetical protein